MDKNDMASKIKSKALELGYDLCGIIKAEPFIGYAAHLGERIEHYPESRCLYERFYELAYPQQIEEWAKSIIVCIRRYGKYHMPKEISKYIAKFYLFDKSTEYEKKSSCEKAFGEYLSNTGMRTNNYCVAERWAAAKAGLGFFGKNNFLYTKFGSWVNINAWIVDKELTYDEPAKKNPACPPDCKKCIDACPTKALSGPFMMNGCKCIAYLSYHTTELLPEDLRDKMGTWLYGCDVCQDVCPLNKNKWVESDEYTIPGELEGIFTLENIVEMDEEMYCNIIQPRFGNINKEGLWIWKCNALRAMANSNNSKYHRNILKACSDDNENIRNMAVWACNKLGLC